MKQNFFSDEASVMQSSTFVWKRKATENIISVTRPHFPTGKRNSPAFPTGNYVKEFYHEPHDTAHFPHATTATAISTTLQIITFAEHWQHLMVQRHFPIVHEFAGSRLHQRLVVRRRCSFVEDFRRHLGGFASTTAVREAYRSSEVAKVR